MQKNNTSIIPNWVHRDIKHWSLQCQQPEAGKKLRRKTRKGEDLGQLQLKEPSPLSSPCVAGLPSPHLKKMEENRGWDNTAQAAKAWTHWSNWIAKWDQPWMRVFFPQAEVENIFQWAKPVWWESLIWDAEMHLNDFNLWHRLCWRSHGLSTHTELKKWLDILFTHMIHYTR